VRPLLLALTLAPILAAMAAGPVAADCDGFVPPFREHATAARRIVIGDVIAVDPSAPWRDDQGRSSRFTLRVRYVLRGQADSVISLRDLPFLPCADHVIEARKGDRIALALNASGFTPRITFNTAAWIKGTPPDGGYERISVRDTFVLLDMKPPDTSIAAAGIEDPFPLAGLTVLLAGVATAVIVLLRRPPHWVH
jgi:hypothetical protein